MTLASPSDMLKFVRIAPGNKVGDFGAGSGAYTSILLERVGHEGRVYALDALPQSLDSIHRAAKARGMRCMTLNCELEQVLPMRDNLLDVAVVANTLHALNPAQRPLFASELSRVVVPGGQVLVVDWAGSFRSMGPPAPLIITPADAVRLLRAAGFATSDMLPAGTHQYAFVATLPR